MPAPTLFDSRTSALCHSSRWKDWAGYRAVCSYESSHEPEYMAIRHGAALIDVSPLYKYRIIGKDAARFLSFVTVRDVTKVKEGRVAYLCWCDDDGKLVDDGTVANLGQGVYRLTSAEPAFSWLNRLAEGFDVSIEDVTTQMGALSLQGPTSAGVLKALGAGRDLESLKYFGVKTLQLAGRPVEVSRTGFTGDLGYEIWVPEKDALSIYDALIETGASYGLMPVGLDAMDVSRIEAGLLINGVDYLPAHRCLIADRTSSPFEAGLGWTVELGREPFIGSQALAREKDSGSAWTFCGLDIDWDETEAQFNEFGLPPEVCSHPWRDGRPIYDATGHWIGMATSGTWSPILKKNLALAQVHTAFAKQGTRVRFELTVEFRRRTVSATVVKTPFFNPPRKRA